MPCLLAVAAGQRIRQPPGRRSRDNVMSTDLQLETPSRIRRRSPWVARSLIDTYRHFYRHFSAKSKLLDWREIKFFDLPPSIR